MIISCKTLGALAFALISLFSTRDSVAQKVNVIGITEVEAMINARDDKTTVINFWATWCGPCIKELPLFDAFHLKEDGAKVILISIDLDLDPDPQKVLKFVKRKKILSDVYMLKQQDANSWIAKIDSSWTGALPATLIVNHSNGKRRFIEGELAAGDLERITSEIK
jgi:thiol-disulfide isomerase/thioredoxin